MSDRQDEIIHRIETIEMLYRERTYIDSLYWRHIEKCSFYSKDEFQIGYQGYIRYIGP